jgi:hypothetical protein
VFVGKAFNLTAQVAFVASVFPRYLLFLRFLNNGLSRGRIIALNNPFHGYI